MTAGRAADLDAGAGLLRQLPDAGGRQLLPAQPIPLAPVLAVLSGMGFITLGAPSGAGSTSGEWPSSCWRC